MHLHVILKSQRFVKKSYLNKWTILVYLALFSRSLTYIIWLTRNSVSDYVVQLQVPYSQLVLEEALREIYWSFRNINKKAVLSQRWPRDAPYIL